MLRGAEPYDKPLSLIESGQTLDYPHTISWTPKDMVAIRYAGCIKNDCGLGYVVVVDGPIKATDISPLSHYPLEAEYLSPAHTPLTAEYFEWKYVYKDGTPYDPLAKDKPAEEPQYMAFLHVKSQ